MPHFTSSPDPSQRADWIDPTIPLQETQELEGVRIAKDASAIHIPQHYMQQLEQLYIFRTRSEILRFLEKYPFLFTLLLEARYNIRQHFPNSPVFLNVVTDPEEFGSDQLVASIATNLDPEKATDTLSLFDKQWWLNALKRAQGKLCITLEFR